MDFSNHIVLCLGGAMLDRFIYDLVVRWKAQALRVGSTNGCYDILHPGHVALLARARSECDRLGADVVQAAGGRVVLAALVPGVSTTGIVARMRQPARAA